MIYTESFKASDYNIKEILRYSASADTASVRELVYECMEEAAPVFSYRACYSEFPISISESRVKLESFEIISKDLAKNLLNCEGAVLFAATVGIGIDRLISKYSILSPAKAVVFQAIGAERIETLCDEFCFRLSRDFEKKGKLLKPRFSPGYGDLSLECQRELFRLLDCQRNIGLTLNESMLMSPSKSVTAIIGISDV